MKKKLKVLLEKFDVVLEHIKDEPVATLTVLGGALYFFTEYGVQVSDTTQAMVLSVAAAILTIWTRKKVTPVRKILREQNASTDNNPKV